MKPHALTLWLLCGSAGVAAAGHEPATAPGRQVFERWCAACHADAPRMPGTASLAAKYGGRLPAALEARDDLNPAMVRYFVRHGISIMPPFRQTEISDAELEALGAYLSRPQAATGERHE